MLVYRVVHKFQGGHMLVVENLCSYIEGKILFSSLAFKLNAGSILRVEGHNGAGKSTLLKLLSGQISPISGSIRWVEEDSFVSFYSEEPDFRKHIIYIGHQTGVRLLLTPLEYLKQASVLATGGEPSALNLSFVLKECGLEHVQHQLCKTLSRGQKQRLSLARFLLLPGRLWLMDEPYTGLDEEGKEWLDSMVVAHSANAGITVMVNHLNATGAFKQKTGLLLDLGTSSSRVLNPASNPVLNSTSNSVSTSAVAASAPV